MNAYLKNKLEKFLSNKIPASDGGGWAKVSDEDMETLYKIFETIISQKYEADADGDSPVEVHLTNRNTHRRHHFINVPYDSFERDGGDDDLTEEILLYNLEIAMNDWQTFTKIKKHKKK